MPVQLKIFLKSIASFMVYSWPFFIIFSSYMLITNALAMRAFKQEAYTYPFHESDIDSYILYSTVGVKHFFADGWSLVGLVSLRRCTAAYGIMAAAWRSISSAWL